MRLRIWSSCPSSPTKTAAVSAGSCLLADFPTRQCTRSHEDPAISPGWRTCNIRIVLFGAEVFRTHKELLQLSRRLDLVFTMQLPRASHESAQVCLTTTS